MNSINCSLPEEMIDQILKWIRLLGPQDDLVHRKAITELNEELLERFTPWSEEEEYYYGIPKWRRGSAVMVGWPEPIWYKHWISHIDERGRIVYIPQTEGWDGVWQEL